MTNYVLVDFENVQPDSLAALATGQFRVKVFVGASQAKGRISFELVHSMQALGTNAEYVKVARTGRNAVDMHIAYYVGRLLEKEPNAAIHIVSKDTDFDPLIEYLHAKGSTCKRVKTIGEIPTTGKPVSPEPPKPVSPETPKPVSPSPPQSPQVGGAQGGDVEVYVAGTGARAFARCANRHLLARPCALRDDRRAASVQRQK